MPDDLHYIARIGMKTGTGVGIETKNLFQTNVTKHKPNLLDLTKLSSPAEFNVVKANPRKAKKKLQCFAVLIPSLAQAIQHTDMTYIAILVEIVKHIKLGVKPPPTPPSEETKEGDTTPSPTPETAGKS